MMNMKTVRVKTLNYSSTYDDLPLISDIYAASEAVSNLSIVDGGFYEVVIDLYAVWNVGGIREVYKTGEGLVESIDNFGSNGVKACGVHKYYIKRNGGSIASAAHIDNPPDSVDLISSEVEATSWAGTTPNLPIPAANITGLVKANLAFTFGLDSNNLKIITPAMVDVNVNVNYSPVSNHAYFDESGTPDDNGYYWRVHNSAGVVIVMYTRLRLNRITQ